MNTPHWRRDRSPIIPHDWSPDQALATFELLNDLMERIWSRYAPDIQTLLQQQQCSDHHAPDNADPDQPPF